MLCELFPFRRVYIYIRNEPVRPRRKRRLPRAAAAAATDRPAGAFKLDRIYLVVCILYMAGIGPETSVSERCTYPVYV